MDDINVPDPGPRPDRDPDLVVEVAAGKRRKWSVSVWQEVEGRSTTRWFEKGRGPSMKPLEIEAIKALLPEDE